jgi:purine-binding chemotaxis protein CheW
MPVSSDKHSRKKFDWSTVKRRLASTEMQMSGNETLTPQQADEVLRTRAKVLAQVPPRQPDTSHVIEVVCFRLGSESYGIATEFVLELTRPNDTTSIPQTEPHFLGVTNLRGKVTAIVDLKQFLGIPTTTSVDPNERSQVLVLGFDQPELAISIDAIEQVMLLRHDELMEPAGLIGNRRDLMMGCTKDGLLVFDGQNVLDCSDLYVDQSD